jgi:serine/threonine protein kinase
MTYTLPAPDPLPPARPGAGRAENASPGDSPSPEDPPLGRDLPTIPPQAVPEEFEHAGAAGWFVGKTAGDFELLEEVGRGGMGIVYKARQKSLHRIVALKTLLAQHFLNPTVLSRFLTEARTAASLAHPNIVKIYQVGECDAGHYFVMEYIDGQSLDILIQERTVPISWAVSLMVTVTEAVHFAHTQGVIHRDLKPSNIMIDRLRRPVVMDFGLAKFLGQPSSITHHGTVMGTPAYIPPEQAGEDAALVGPASDVYSLGGILYTLLTGRPPFLESSSLKTVLKVIGPEPPARVRSFRSDVPPRLEHICMKCLRKDPAERYHSAQVLAKRLRKVLSGLPQSASISLRHTLPLVFLTSQESGQQLRLFSPVNVLGRASECDVIVRASDVSKRHCQILLKTEQVVVEDLGSSNGTIVNGRPVGLALLKDGDLLDLAGHVFEIRIPRSKKK